jgi:hypothetical protein
MTASVGMVSAAQGPVLTDSHLENEAANSIRVPLLALVLLLNHVVYKNIPALMDNMYYPCFGGEQSGHGFDALPGVVFLM